MGIRLIASDMDGTLLDGQGQISPGNQEALRKAQERGVQLCIASGRIPYEIDKLVDPLGMPFHYLALNGGLVRSPGLPDIAFPLSADEVALCVDAGNRAGARWVLFTAQDLMASSLPEEDWFGLRRVATREEALEAAGRGEILKFIAVCGKDGDFEALARARGEVERGGMAVASSGRDNFEVNPPGVDKGVALRALARRLGIDQGDVMALGDYENDLTMLGWAGVSVAMGNATAAVTAAAKYSTLPHTQDGVAAAIRRFVLS